VKLVQQSETGVDGKAPQVLLLAPPPVAKLTEFAEMFEGSDAKSRKLGHHYRQIAEELGCEFLDISDVIVSSDIDGIHFEAEEHRKLGETVASIVKKIFD
jgi:lysophospholipase L1-like esterase